MLKNFENQTIELNKNEILLATDIIKIIKSNKEEAITSNQIIHLFDGNYDLKITGARVRKIINYICNNYLPNLIGTSKGYYTTNDIKELITAAGTLQSRANENNKRADIILKYLKQK